MHGPMNIKNKFNYHYSPLDNLQERSSEMLIQGDSVARGLKLLSIKNYVIEIMFYSGICQLQLGLHPVAVVQYTFTHKQYI